MAAWCSARGVVAVRWLEERVSGGAELEKRPVMTQALDSLRELGAGVLLVAKRDRLARDPIVSAMIERIAERNGARVMSAAGEGEGNGPTDQLMRRIVDAFAEYERLIIRHRTKAALAVKKDRHELTGNAPYGWRVVPDSSPVQLEPDPEEQAAAALARELRAQGESLRRIAMDLEARGVKTRGGGQWKAETVRGLIAAPEATRGR